MRYKLLGHSGVRVSELCLGTMTFGETWGWGASEAESRRQFDLFAEQGGNFIDTSVNYTDGTSEEFVGKFLHEAGREKWVLATKFSLTHPNSTDPNSGNSRKNLRQSVERSLTRLQTDYIDLLYLHAWDYMTPVEEVVRGLDDLVRQGKVLYVAFSDTPAYIVAEANTYAQAYGFSRFVAYQIPYSLSRRDVERDVLPCAQHWDMAVLPWGILGAGVLLGKYRPDSNETTRANPANVKVSERTETIIDEIAKIADETGKSRTQVCVNWVRQQQHRAQILPILGARTTEQLQDNLAALEWELDADQLQRLEEVSAIELGFPHDFLHGNRYLFGATRDLIDSHRM